MIKSTLAAVAASPFLFAGAAFAGPYVNVEVNSSLTGSDYTGTTTEAQIGWEGENWYVSGGPIVTAADGGDSTTDFIGYLGGSVDVTDYVGVYGEFSLQTAEDSDNGYGVKLGTRYTF